MKSEITPLKSLTKDDLKLLNSKQGLYHLMKNKKFNLQKVLNDVRHEIALQEFQEELIKMQQWVIENNKKVVILFEGRDAAGKGGAIRRITEYLNPRQFKVIALNVPTEDERQQWFFQRYIQHLPKPGEMVFFDRSWYNRAVVEPVNGFCSTEEYEIFMTQVNDFENMLIQSDTYMVKFYFSISKDEQERRFEEIKKNPLKRWKMTAVDAKAQGLWDEYTKYKNVMFEKTNTEKSPWIIVEANQKPAARLRAIKHVLENIPYQ